MIFPVHILPEFSIKTWSTPRMELQSGFDRCKNSYVLELPTGSHNRLAFPLKAHFPDQNHCVQFSDRNDVILEQERAKKENPNIIRDAGMVLAQFSLLYDHDSEREAFLYQITRFLTNFACGFSGETPDSIQTLLCTKHFVCVNAPFSLSEEHHQTFGTSRLENLTKHGFDAQKDRILAVAPIGLQGLSSHAKLSQLGDLKNEREMLCSVATDIAGHNIHTGVF